MGLCDTGGQRKEKSMKRIKIIKEGFLQEGDLERAIYSTPRWEQIESLTSLRRRKVEALERGSLVRPLGPKRGP